MGFLSRKRVTTLESQVRKLCQVIDSAELIAYFSAKLSTPCTAADRAERKCGQLLAEREKAKGNRYTGKVDHPTWAALNQKPLSNGASAKANRNAGKSSPLFPISRAMLSAKQEKHDGFLNCLAKGGGGVGDDALGW
jgi:hypothetical protein